MQEQLKIVRTESKGKEFYKSVNCHGRTAVFDEL